MANLLLTPQIIARAALPIFTNSLTFLNRVNKDFQADFDGRYNGNAPGNTILIRKQPSFVAANGRNAYIQDIVEANTVMTIATQKHVAFQMTSFDKALTITEMNARYLTSAMSSLANSVEVDCIAQAVAQTYNSVGTPGTVPTSLTPFANAQAKLDMLAVPTAGRAVIVEPLTSWSLIDNLKGLFNPGDMISQQYKSGKISQGTYHLDWGMDQNIPTQTTGIGGQGGTPVVNGANQSGNSLVASGFAASSVVFQAGDVFTIAGVYAVNPMSKSSTGQLQQFVVTAQVTSSAGGAATIPIAPPIVFNNADGSPSTVRNVSALPANGASITAFASAGVTTSRQNLVFGPDAYTFAAISLDLKGGADDCYIARDKETGMAVRVWMDSDIRTDVSICRIDVGYGFAATRPESAVRVWA